MKVKISQALLETIIRRVIHVLNEDPIDQNLTKMRMFKNVLKQDQKVLPYPSQKDLNHEAYRIKTMYMDGKPGAFERRLTTITSPQKMYDCYIACLQWKIAHPETKKDMERFANIARNYLRKFGYENLPVGRGNHIPVDVSNPVTYKNVGQKKY